jgi:hypothetical protein
MKVSLKPGTGFHQNHPFELEERKPAGKKSLWRGLLRWMLFAIGGCIGLAVLAYLSIQTWPAIGAHGADILRRIIGDQAVASLEMKVNQFQDGIQKLKYDAGWDKPSAPWETVQVPTPALPATLPATGTETSIPEAINPVAPVSTQIPVSLELPQPSPTPPPSI